MRISWTTAALAASLGAFSRALHVFFGFGASCRYFPSCSAYARTALQRFGWWKGSALTVRRLLRCHPWADSGWDPVPME